MKQSLPGYDVNYRYGSNPVIDKAVDDLNVITMPYYGGIANLDEQGNVVKRYTDKVVLDLPDNVPADVLEKAKKAAVLVLHAMGVTNIELKDLLSPTKGIGLGAEKNAQIAEYLLSGNSSGLLQLINQSENKDLVCEVVIKSMFDFNHNGRYNTVNDLSSMALVNENYMPALKALIIYTWKNHLQGERFWANPFKEGETLFVDDDNELISFKGDIATIQQGLQGAGMNYIRDLNEYTVLSGPNEGKVFNGGYDAKGQENSRPIKGPKLDKLN